MTDNKTCILAAQFVFLAVVSVRAQSAASPYAMPSERGSPQLGKQTGFRVTSRVKATKSRRPGNASLVTRGGLQLCFLPGIGWQRSPSATTTDTTNLTEIQSSDLNGEKPSTIVGIVRRVYKHPSGMGLNTSAPCTGSFSSVTAAEVLKEDYGGAAASPNPVSINSGSKESLYPNPLINDPSTNATDNSMPRHRAMDVRGTGTLLEPSGELTGRAHMSSIELRREIRNAPDLATRIRLRRLQNELERKSRALVVNATERQIPKRHLKGSTGRRDNSSSLYSVRDHANGRKRFSLGMPLD